MIYKSNDKYYIKLSGYLVEVLPFLNDGVLDFKPTENSIEITADVSYKSVNLDTIKEELQSSNSKKVDERTHKYKFNYKD